MQVKQVRHIPGYGKEVIFKNYRRVVVQYDGGFTTEYIGRANYEKYIAMAKAA